MHKEKDENGLLSHMHHHDAYRSRELNAFEHSLSDGDMFLQVSATLFSCYAFISSSFVVIPLRTLSFVVVVAIRFVQSIF